MGVKLPLEPEAIEALRVGEILTLDGIMYCARDAAHHRLIEAMDAHQALPFDIRGQTIYYMGPTPTKPGHVIGSAGPTTSGRMDIYTPRLLAAGLRAMIGKGSRSQEVKDAIKKHKAVYFAPIAGAGALIAKSIMKVEIVAYEDLGPEAILRLEVKDFLVIVINDIYGGDLYEQGMARYRKASA
jgi:fumarate hydratase subunit beta